MKARPARAFQLSAIRPAIELLPKGEIRARISV
jgi:hypothetical protein